MESQFYLPFILGLRPERKKEFDNVSWGLMQSCWAADPSKRPLLGCVEPQLESIMNKLNGEGKNTFVPLPQIELKGKGRRLSSGGLTSELNLDVLTADWIPLDRDSSVYIEKEKEEQV